ncbi:MAG: exosortase, partial [Armatimonadetes bacterium]|nr:exosortase [Armatimonadota bacterium]
MGRSPENSNITDNQAAKNFILSYWPLVLVCALFASVQWPVFKSWWVIWNETDSYYSHGPIVPFISGFMIWCNRRTLARTKIQPSWWGLLILIASVPLQFITTLINTDTLHTLTFFCIVFGTLLLLFGWRVTKVLFVPVAFLVTMIPIASWALDAATARAQLVSAGVAEKFLYWSGYEIVRYGNTIVSSDLPQPLMVGTPCSGLRLLISLITFSWFFVYVVEGARWKKWFLMLLSLPLAVFINSLRITMIGYAGFWTGSAEAMHTFHDYSGYIGLIICFVILFGIAKLIRVGDFRFQSGSGSEDDERVGSEWRVPKVAIIATVLSLVGLAIISNAIEPLYDLPKGKLDRQNFPASFGTWSSTDLEIDKTTKRILNKGDLLSRIYTDATTGRQVQVFLCAAVDTFTFHDPHLCMPGGGSPITKDRPVNLTFTRPKPISVRATILQAKNDYATTLVLYWYMQGQISYPRTENLRALRRADMMEDIRAVV